MMHDFHPCNDSHQYHDFYQYHDIIDLPRHISSRHAPMESLARAAIFSPYAALTGFEGQISDARQHRCDRILLSDEELAPVNALLSSLKKKDSIAVTYFQHDPGTDGKGSFAEGEYISIRGKVLSIIPAYQTLRVGNSSGWTDILFEDILSLQKCTT